MIFYTHGKLIFIVTRVIYMILENKWEEMYVYSEYNL